MPCPPSSPPPRSIDIDIAALLLFSAGGLGMAGLVAMGDCCHAPDLVLRAVAMAAGMLLFGIGLWQRREWTRRGMVVLALCVIQAQLSRRWLQSEVPHTLVEGIRGLGVQADNLYSSALLNLPPPEVGPAAFGLVVCALLAWLVLRLLSRRVSAEFAAGRREPTRLLRLERNKT